MGFNMNRHFFYLLLLTAQACSYSINMDMSDEEITTHNKAVGQWDKIYCQLEPDANTRILKRHCSTLYSDLRLFEAAFNRSKNLPGNANALYRHTMLVRNHICSTDQAEFTWKGHIFQEEFIEVIEEIRGSCK